MFLGQLIWLRIRWELHGESPQSRSKLETRGGSFSVSRRKNCLVSCGVHEVVEFDSDVHASSIRWVVLLGPHSCPYIPLSAYHVRYP